MLNTDAHNPNIASERKMTKEGFFRNNRKLNGGQDFPQQYLSDLFDNIINNEIQLSSELKDTDGGGFLTRKWNNVLSSKNPGKFETSAPRAHGKEMFTLLWDSAVHTLEFYLFRLAPNVYAHMLEGAEPPLVRDLRRGFANFALICSRYALGDVFNNLIISVSNSLCAVLEQISEQEQAASVFGRDTRCRLAVDILFALVKQHGPSLVKEGWTNVLHVVLWLRKLNLLPAGLSDMEDFRDSKGQHFDSLRASPETTAIVEESAGGGGVVSALSSAFSFFFAANTSDEGDESASESEAGETEAPPPKEDANVLAAKACVEACDISGVFTASKHYEIGSLKALMRALLLVSSHGSGAQSLSSEVFSPAVLDQEAAVFCLERITDVLAHNQTRSADEVAPLWATVHDHFSLALASGTGDATFYLERVVVNLLLHFPVRLLRDPARTCAHVMGLLTCLQTLSPQCHNALGTRVVAGLQIFLETHAEHITTSEQWKSLLDLLLQYRGHTHASNSAFKSMEFVTENQLTFESFVPLVTAYINFAQPLEQVWQPVGPPAVLDGLLRLYTKLTVLGVPVEGEGVRAVSKREQDALAARRTDLWLFTLQCLCQVCGDGRVEVRMKAIACLQHALLSAGVKIKSPKAWHLCFEKLLIPLLDLVAQFAPTIAQAKEGGDIRLKAATVVFQTFLHNLDTISALPDFHIFWLKFIGSMERHMKGNAGQSVSVHFTEWLKNVLLVMHANGTFDLASKRSGQDLWALTWAVITLYHYTSPHLA
jgi:brefeldin A-resistance guanine nucleotide exchange factor 1